MPSEWYNIENSVDTPAKEKELIEETVPHLSTIMSSIFGNIEEFNQYGGTVSVINNSNQPTGINITYALFGDQQLQYSPDSAEFEQYNKISIFNSKTNKHEFVAILLNRDNSIKDIQTNILPSNNYPIYSWLLEAYRKIDNILNYPENYYLDRKDFIYHGPEEAEELTKQKKNLGIY
jgi:hypothetical protein